MRGREHNEQESASSISKRYLFRQSKACAEHPLQWCDISDVPNINFACIRGFSWRHMKAQLFTDFLTDLRFFRFVIVTLCTEAIHMNHWKFFQGVGPEKVRLPLIETNECGKKFQSRSRKIQDVMIERLWTSQYNARRYGLCCRGRPLRARPLWAYVH